MEKINIDKARAGDKILLKDEHYKQADSVIRLIDDKRKKSTVLIGGVSGSGKTETAIIVQKKLYEKGISSLIVSIDDYYDTHWKVRDEIRRKRGIGSVGVKEIQWGKLEKIVKDFNDQKELTLDRINKYSGHIETVRTSADFRVLIIEGLYAAYLKDYADVMYVILEKVENTYSFRKERGKEDPDDEFRKLVVEKEQDEVERLSKGGFKTQRKEERTNGTS